MDYLPACLIGELVRVRCHNDLYSWLTFLIVQPIVYFLVCVLAKHVFHRFVVH